MTYPSVRRPTPFVILFCVLLAAALSAQTPPSIGGAWTCAGRPTSISQDAGGRLVFTNEYGQKSSGSFANATTVIATDWEGGLRGALQDNGNTIRWANGTAWSRSAASTTTTLAGAWTSAGRPASISQDAGGRLVFTNEYGQKSSGSFANATTVIATDWEGGLRGALQDNGNTIRWANGTAWSRSAAAPFSGSSPAATQDLGATLVLIYPSVCTAIWTRTQPGIYDSVTVCQGPGNASFRETLTVRSYDGKTVIINRPNYGQYRGTLSADHRTIRGTCDWAGCTPNCRWTAYIDWNWNDSPPLR